jgi:hypothetical protein
MMGHELMEHYQMLMRGETAPVPMKVQVMSLIVFMKLFASIISVILIFARLFLGSK